jgi:hypothetical protein
MKRAKLTTAANLRTWRVSILRSARNISKRRATFRSLGREYGPADVHRAARITAGKVLRGDRAEDGNLVTLDGS